MSDDEEEYEYEYDDDDMEVENFEYTDEEEAADDAEVALGTWNMSWWYWNRTRIWKNDILNTYPFLWPELGWQMPFFL